MTMSVEAPRRKSALPKLPDPLEEEVQRVAIEIVEGRMADARKVAALETANRLLTTVAALLKHATGISVPTRVSVVPTPKVPTNPCVLCGQPGTWQDRAAKLAPGSKPPWYCKIHAQGAIQEQRQEVAGAGLLQALKQAAPIDDATLHE